MDENYLELDPSEPMRAGDQWLDRDERKWKSIPSWWIGSDRITPDRTSFRVRRPRALLIREAAARLVANAVLFGDYYGVRADDLETLRRLLPVDAPGGAKCTS